MNAEDYQSALQIDPTLPDPASVGYGNAAAMPPADPALLREEAFVGPPAKPYVFRGVTALDRERAHYCLTAAIYYEAASETDDGMRSEEHTSELQSLMRISYAVFCLKKKKIKQIKHIENT